MQELRFVAVSEDGQYAVLGVPGRSARFTLPIDERLRAVALGQTSRLAQYEIEVESPLRPKEIQARIRAGETVEEIADAAGIAVERVRWFEGPVLAERAYMADQAQKASVRRQGDATPGPQLGEIVAERMKAFGAEPDDAQWDAKKRSDGSWLVQLTFISAGLLHAAEWVFDPRRRHVLPADDNAARMSLPGSEPPQPAAPAPGEATVTHLAPRLNTAAGFGPGGAGNGAMGNGLGNGLGQGGRPRYERPAAALPAAPEPKVAEWEASQSRETQSRERHSPGKLSHGNPSPAKRRLERLRPGNPRPESHCRRRTSRASLSGASPRLRPPPRRRCRALPRPVPRGWPPKSRGRRPMPRRRASSPRLDARLRPRGTGGQPRSPGSRRNRRSPGILRRASRCRRRPAEPPRRRPRRLPLRRLPLSRPRQPRRARHLSRRPRASRRRAKAGRQRAVGGPRCRPGTRSCSATRASGTSPAERTGSGVSWRFCWPGADRVRTAAPEG